MLRWREEVIFGHVGVKLTLDNFLNQFGERRHDRNGSKVRRVGGVTSFMNGMYGGVFP